MIQFDCLYNILAMDFTQLRALDGRATDACLFVFTTNISGFFTQTGHVTSLAGDERDEFHRCIASILENINTTEENYFLQKYTREYDDLPTETIIKMARSMHIKDLHYLPTRMQYWAASEHFGDCIRNPVEHRQAVKSLQTWCAPSTISQHMFLASNETTPQHASIAPSSYRR